MAAARSSEERLAEADRRLHEARKVEEHLRRVAALYVARERGR